MPDEHPRRRITDRDRRNWPDPRLDEMRADVDDLQGLERQVGRLLGLRDSVEALRDLLEVQAQRVTDVRQDVRANTNAVRALQHRMNERFDAVDSAHDRTEKRAQGIDPDTEDPLPPPFRPDWHFWLKLAGLSATGVGVPIAVALIAGGH